jgi:hypothetical protein
MSSTKTSPPPPGSGVAAAVAGRRPLYQEEDGAWRASPGAGARVPTRRLVAGGAPLESGLLPGSVVTSWVPAVLPSVVPADGRVRGRCAGSTAAHCSTRSATGGPLPRTGTVETRPPATAAGEPPSASPGTVRTPDAHAARPNPRSGAFCAAVGIQTGLSSVKTGPTIQ